MRTAKISQTERLSHMHNRERGACPVIRIITDLPQGGNNSFYISPTDKDGKDVRIADDNPLTTSQDLELMKEGDEITFDKQSFLQKEVIWNNRRFRQRGYSFDFYGSLYAPAMKN